MIFKRIIVLMVLGSLFLSCAGCLQSPSTTNEKSTPSLQVSPSPTSAPEALMQVQDDPIMQRAFMLEEVMGFTLQQADPAVYKEIERIDTLISKNPNDEELWNQKGFIIFTKSLDAEGATFCFDRALELNPRYIPALNNLGYMSRNYYPSSSSFYDRALSVNPGHPIVLNNKGTALIALIDLESHEGQTVNSTKRHTSPYKTEALHYFDRALEQDPDDPVIWNNKGMAIWFFSNRSATNYEQIIACFDTALSLDPTFKYASINKNRVIDWYTYLKASA